METAGKRLGFVVGKKGGIQNRKFTELVLAQSRSKKSIPALAQARGTSVASGEVHSNRMTLPICQCWHDNATLRLYAE